MCRSLAQLSGRTSSQNLHFMCKDLFSCTNRKCFFRVLALEKVLPHWLHWTSFGAENPSALRWTNLCLGEKICHFGLNQLKQECSIFLRFQSPYIYEGLFTSRLVAFVWPIIEMCFEVVRHTDFVCQGLPTQLTNLWYHFPSVPLIALSTDTAPIRWWNIQ